VKQFPIMSMIPRGRRYYIPFAMLLEHEAQAKKNHDQTLQYLAKRGGLSSEEANAILEDRAPDWRMFCLPMEREAAEKFDQEQWESLWKKVLAWNSTNH